jgi:hexosaminidase
MLDVSRHFYDMAYLKKMINVMAYLKMNTFHLHLTDDQGWRIEIKKYPNLTKMGAFRDDLRSQKWTYFQYGVSGNKPVYGGFYTQNEMKELVAYASEKNITIIPEIDLPGHSWSAIYSYNNLSCSGKTWKKPNDVPFQFSDPLCVCDPNVLQFTKDVMTEIIDIFPSQYIHIGGDECRHEAWNDYVTCRDLMKKENLKNTAELQSWFNRELEAHIISKGRKIIGWDEILEGGITPSAAVMSWRGEKGGIEAAKHHHQVVMSPATHCYLDMPQSVTEKSEGWLKLLPLEKVYSYEPTPDTLTSDEKKYILGVQGNLWTENVQTTEQADYQFFPRGVAIAEVAWSNVSKKNYKDFLERLNTWYQILDKFKVQYAVPNPYLLLKEYVIIKPTYLKPIFDKNNNSKVVYTLDGTEPNQNSSVLNDSVLVSKSGTLKMVSVLKNGSISKTFSAEIKLQQPLVSNLMSNNLDKGRLNTNYYEGIINSIKEWNKLKLISKFKSEKIEIPKLARKDSFAVDFEGFIEIPITGVYTFSLTSDDGSILYINDTEFINYDGTHGAEEKSKQIAFEKGIFKFKLSYFEALYGETLNLYIEGPGLPKQAIPSSMIYTSK